jgi:hypothetical protein
VTQGGDNSGSAYRDLSGGEIQTLKQLQNYSGIRILREHRNLVRLVSKVRRRLEEVVDAAQPGWLPNQDFSFAYATTVTGGARLCDSYYKREKTSPLGALPDGQLNAALKQAAGLVLDEIPFEELEAVYRRRRFVLRNGETTPPKDERRRRAGRLPGAVIDVESQGDE